MLLISATVPCWLFCLFSHIVKLRAHASASMMNMVCLEIFSAHQPVCRHGEHGVQRRDGHFLPKMPASAPLAAPELHQLAAKGTVDEVQFVQARMYALLPALHFQMGWLASAHHCKPHKMQACCQLDMQPQPHTSCPDVSSARWHQGRPVIVPGPTV